MGKWKGYCKLIWQKEEERKLFGKWASTLLLMLLYIEARNADCCSGLRLETSVPESFGNVIWIASGGDMVSGDLLEVASMFHVWCFRVAAPFHFVSSAFFFIWFFRVPLLFSYIFAQNAYLFCPLFLKIFAMNVGKKVHFMLLLLLMTFMHLKSVFKILLFLLLHLVVMVWSFSAHLLPLDHNCIYIFLILLGGWGALLFSLFFMECSGNGNPTSSFLSMVALECLSFPSPNFTRDGFHRHAIWPTLFLAALDKSDTSWWSLFVEALVAEMERVLLSWNVNLRSKLYMVDNYEYFRDMKHGFFCWNQLFAHLFNLEIKYECLSCHLNILWSIFGYYSYNLYSWSLEGQCLKPRPQPIKT